MTAWMPARGTGLAAVALLTASMLLGLAMSFRVRSPRWPRGLVNEAHRTITLWALAATAAHVALLLADSRAGIGPLQALVPLSAASASLEVGLGVLAFYAVVVVHATTRLRARLGTRRWRVAHRFAYAGFGLAMLHGVLAGSDTGRPWATALYVGAALAVGLATMYRVWPEPPPAGDGPTPGVAGPPTAAAAGPPPLGTGTNAR